MTDSFWTGGSEACYDGINAHYEAKLAELYAVLVDCEDQLERRDIEKGILIVKAEFNADFRRP